MKTPNIPMPRLGWAGGADSWNGKDETWIETEDWAYRGGFKRRARVMMPDGSLRVVKATLADTYSTIPARVKIKGKTMRGYIDSSDTGVFTFHFERTE